MRYFYDTEFIEDGKTVDLISIGIVADDGREYYAVNADMPIDRIREHTWLVDNVVPTLPMRNAHARLIMDVDRSNRLVKPPWVIANEVRDFVLTPDSEAPELWAYFGAYDHVVLCQLFGTMMQLPDGMPMFTHELMQLWEQAGRPDKPEQGEGEHNALEDARWNAKLYAACVDTEFI